MRVFERPGCHRYEDADEVTGRAVELENPRGSARDVEVPVRPELHELALIEAAASRRNELAHEGPGLPVEAQHVVVVVAAHVEIAVRAVEGVGGRAQSLDPGTDEVIDEGTGRRIEARDLVAREGGHVQEAVGAEPHAVSPRKLREPRRIEALDQLAGDRVVAMDGIPVPGRDQHGFRAGGRLLGEEDAADQRGEEGQSVGSGKRRRARRCARRRVLAGHLTSSPGPLTKTTPLCQPAPCAGKSRPRESGKTYPRFGRGGLLPRLVKWTIPSGRIVR